MEQTQPQSIRIDEPALDKTEKLLEQILPPLLFDDSRVHFLCPAGEGQPVVQRVRVMLSRKRKQLESRGKKSKKFKLHTSVHPETHDGKRFDRVVMWRSINEIHHMTQELEDILSNG